MADTEALAPWPMLPLATVMAPVLLTVAPVWFAVVCVMAPSASGVPASVSLLLLAENDDAAPIALIDADDPVPETVPVDVMMPLLVIAPKLLVV